MVELNEEGTYALKEAAEMVNKSSSVLVSTGELGKMESSSESVKWMVEPIGLYQERLVQGMSCQGKARQYGSP